MALFWNRVPTVTSKMCRSFPFFLRPPPAILNYGANQDDLNSKARVAYEVGHLTVNQNRGPKMVEGKRRGLADLTQNIITVSEGVAGVSPFMQIAPLSLEVHY